MHQPRAADNPDIIGILANPLGVIKNEKRVRPSQYIDNEQIMLLKYTNIVLK